MTTEVVSPLRRPAHDQAHDDKQVRAQTPNMTTFNGPNILSFVG
ncbi:hypothetical protein [Bradyrhizobium sp. LA7.1]